MKLFVEQPIDLAFTLIVSSSPAEKRTPRGFGRLRAALGTSAALVRPPGFSPQEFGATKLPTCAKPSGSTALFELRSCGIFRYVKLRLDAFSARTTRFIFSPRVERRGRECAPTSRHRFRFRSTRAHV